MKNRISPISAIVFLICILICCSSAFGQRPVVVPIGSGGTVAVSARTEPSDAANPFTSIAEVEFDKVIHRLIVNDGAGYYFGYDLIVTPLPASRQFKVMVKPFDPEYDESVLSRPSFKKRNIGRADQKGFSSAVSKPSTPQTVDDGGSFAIDLLVNTSTGAKVFDVIKISFDDLRPGNSLAPISPPRDFTLDDVELTVRNYRLLIDGNLVSSRLATGFSAPILWFYLPGKGRFIFSVKPREGYNFQKIGVAEHNNLTFTIDGEHYVWSSTSPIIERGGNWNIWILHDPSYKRSSEPAGSSTHKRAPNNSEGDSSVNPLDWGMAKNIENLFPKRKD